jgi:hypothetical protein
MELARKNEWKERSGRSCAPKLLFYFFFLAIFFCLLLSFFLLVGWWCGCSHQDVVRLLLHAGANRNATAGNGESPMDAARRFRKLGVLRLLEMKDVPPPAQTAPRPSAQDDTELKSARQRVNELELLQTELTQQIVQLQQQCNGVAALQRENEELRQEVQALRLRCEAAEAPRPVAPAAEAPAVDETAWLAPTCARLAEMGARLELVHADPMAVDERAEEQMQWLRLFLAQCAAPTWQRLKDRILGAEQRNEPLKLSVNASGTHLGLAEQENSVLLTLPLMASAEEMLIALNNFFAPVAAPAGAAAAPA